MVTKRYEARPVGSGALDSGPSRVVVVARIVAEVRAWVSACVRAVESAPLDEAAVALNSLVTISGDRGYEIARAMNINPDNILYTDADSALVYARELARVIDATEFVQGVVLPLTERMESTDVRASYLELIDLADTGLPVIILRTVMTLVPPPILRTLYRYEMRQYDKAMAVTPSSSNDLIDAFFTVDAVAIVAPIMATEGEVTTSTVTELRARYSRYGVYAATSDDAMERALVENSEVVYDPLTLPASKILGIQPSFMPMSNPYMPDLSMTH